MTARDEGDEDTMTTEHAATPGTGPWTVTPDLVQYMVLREEGSETLMLAKHGHTDHDIAAVIRHAGFGRILDPIMVNGQEVAGTGTAVAELHRFETWARKVHGCRRHWWLPWWVRHGVIRPLDWVRWTVFRLLWRTLWRGTDPLDQPRPPGWVMWLGKRWRAFADCDVCEYVDHYRTCRGCGFCSSDGTGKAPPWWDWATPDGAPRDANAGRPGYLPVTVVDLEG